jgi:hypothetical protein
MKPIPIVLTINLAVFAVLGLFFVVVVNRPELIPLFTSIQTAFNLLGIGVFYQDRKMDIMKAFLFGFLLVFAVTVTGYILLRKYRHLIGLEENFTVMVDRPVTIPHLPVT